MGQKIPVKIGRLTLNGEAVRLDTHGLDAEIWSEKDLHVSLHPDAKDSDKCLFRLRDRFKFCGVVYLYGSADQAVNYYMYSKN